MVDWADRHRVVVELASAEAAVLYTGPLYWREVELALGRPVIVDCAELPGPAMASLRAGLKLVLFAGSDPVATKLAGMAAVLGAEIRKRLQPPVAVLAPEDNGRAIAARLAAACLGPAAPAL